MSGLGAASFLGGLAQGAETGMSLKDKLIAQQAKQAIGRAMQAETQPPPQAAPPPAAPPRPPMGAAPPPGPPGGGMGGPMPPPGGGLAGMGQRPPAPPAAPPPPPQAAPPPPQAQQGPPPGSNPDLSGTADPTGGFSQDASKTMALISGKIAKANPGIKPEVLFEAVNQQIGMMKGLDSEARTYMQAAAMNARTQAGMQEAILKADSAQEALEIKLEAQQKMLDDLNAAKAAMQAGKDKAAGERTKMQSDARVQSAGIGAAARESAAATGADARVESANIGAGSRERVADTNAGARGASDDTRRDITDTDALAKVNTARAAKRLPPLTQLPGGRTARRTTGPRTQSGGGAPPADSPYKSLNDLKAAHQAGKISAEDARQVAKANGWAS